MAQIAVKVCKKCQKIKKFDKFVDMPVEIRYAINAQEIEVIDMLCPDCILQNSRLLPVPDRNAEQLEASNR